MAGYGRIMTAEELNKGREANYNPGFLQNIADTAVSELSGLAESGLRGASNMFGGVEGLEEGADWFKQKRYDRRNAGIRKEWLDQGISAVLNPEFWTDPRGAAAVGTSFLVQSLPFGVVGGAAGLGARAAGAGLKGVLAASAGTAGALDAFTNTAEGIEELRKQGLSEREIRDRRLKAMAAEIIPDTAAGLPLFYLLLGRGFGGGLKGALTAGGIEFGTEWLQEMFQQINNERWLNNKPWRLPTEQEVKQTALQTIPAFALGAGGNFASNNDETQPQPQTQTQTQERMNSRDDVEDDPNYNEIKNEAWKAAQFASQYMQEKYGKTKPPEWIYAQWAFETGNFTSDLTKYNKNLGGLTQTEPNGEENKQPDGGNYYKKYDTIEEYARDYVDGFVNPRLRPELWEYGNEDFQSHVQALHDTGYFESSPEEYYEGASQYLNDHPNIRRNTNSTYEQPTQFNNEQKADNRPQIQYEESRPLFNLQDLLKDENVESGLAEDIIEDYYRSVNQEESNPTRKRLAKEMLNEQGEFNVNRENIRKIIEQDPEGLSEFIEENADTYFPRPTRPKSEIYEDMQGTAEDLKTAVDRKHYPSYKQAANRMKELQFEWNPKYVGRRHRQPNEPENAVTKQERNQLLRDAYDQKLAAEFNGDKQALKEINARIKEIENLPIVESHARNYPRIKTEQEEMDEEAKKILDDFNRIRNEEKLDDKEDRLENRNRNREQKYETEEELSNDQYPDLPRDSSSRLTVPEVIKRAGLENQHPTDAGSLHVETLPQDDDSDLTTVKLNGNINKIRGKTSNTISNLARMAKELGGSYNSRNRTFNFKDPEDADTFSEASQQYLDNGYESLKPDKVKPEESESVEEESTPEDIKNLDKSLNNAKDFINEQRKQSKDDPNVNDVLDHMEKLLDNPEAVDRNNPKQAQQDIQSLMKEAGDLINRIGRDNYINEVESPKNPKESGTVYTKENGFNFDVVDRESAREILKKLGLSRHPADAGTLHVEIDEENPRLARIEGKRDSKAKKEEAKPGLNKIARYIGGEYKPKIHAFEFLDPADTKQFKDVGYYYLDNEEIDETSPRIVDEEEEKRQLVRDWIDKTTKKFTGREIRKYSPQNVSKLEGEPQRFEDLPNIKERAENLDAGIKLDMKQPRIMDKFKGTGTRKKRIPDAVPESTPEDWLKTAEKAQQDIDNEPTEKPNESEEVEENLDLPSKKKKNTPEKFRGTATRKKKNPDVSPESTPEDWLKTAQDSQSEVPENKKSSTMEELPDGYHVEGNKSLDEANSKDFIVDKNENRDFGEISKDIEKATGGRVKSAPIRLQVGNESFGYIHMEKHIKQIQGKGFGNAIDFINHTINNFNQIYIQQKKDRQGDVHNRYVIYCKGDKSKGFIPMDLEIRVDDGQYYSIVTATPHGDKIKGTLVYDGSADPSADSTYSTLSPANNDKGGDGAGTAHTKTSVPSEESLSQNDEGKKIDQQTFENFVKTYNGDVETLLNDDRRKYIEQLAADPKNKLSIKAKGAPFSEKRFINGEEVSRGEAAYFNYLRYLNDGEYVPENNENPRPYFFKFAHQQALRKDNSYLKPLFQKKLEKLGQSPEDIDLDYLLENAVKRADGSTSNEYSDLMKLWERKTSKGKFVLSQDTINRIQESSKPVDDIETVQDSSNEEETDSDDVKNEMQKKLDEADLTDSERKDLQNLLEKISSNKKLSPSVKISSFEHQLKKVLKKKNSDKPVETSKHNETDGKNITLFSDNNKKYNAKYKVVSAKDLITSHELSGSSYITNRNYPQELQPRDRERATMQTEVSSMAGDIIPEQITSSLNLNQGAPVVRSDGVVLNGNGRTLALITAYKRNLADNYKKYLIEHSEEFGIDRNKIDEIEQPILIREITDELTDEEIQDVINSTTGGSRLGSSEKAVNDSKKLKLADLQGYEENETGDLTTAGNAGYVWNIASKIIPAKEMNEYTTKDGEINADGIIRVKRALFSVAYKDPGLIEKMAQSTDDIIKDVSNALMYAAPQIAHTQLSINEGHSENYPLSETISAAVKLYENAKREEIPIALIVRRNESAMFDRESDETMKILEIMEQNKRKSRQLGQFFSTIAKYIEEQGDPNQSSLFGEGFSPKLTFQEILDASYRTVFERNLQTNQADINAERVHNATAKNKQLADLAKQLGAVKMAGKFTFTNPAMEQRFLEVLDSPYGVNIAYHGSGADFDTFSLDKIGTGEGEQGYGWGFYFAKEEDTAKWYRDRLESRLGFEKEREVIVNNERYHESYRNRRTVWTNIDTGEEVTDDDFNKALTIKSNNEDPQSNPDKKDLINLAIERYKDNPKLVKLLKESKKWTATTLHNGKMFQLNLPSVKFLLDEQKSFDKQSKFVQDVLRELDKQNPKYFEGFLEKRSGKSLYEGISRIEGSPKKASEKLLSQGIEGLAYDGGANGKCFVIFNPKAIQILRKYSMKRDKLGKQLQNLKILAPEDLTDRQKAIQEMGQRLGVPVVYFEGNRNLHGFQSGGISFLNKNSATSIEWTFWHEFFHALKSRNNNFYKQILNEIKKSNPFSSKQIQKYREEIGAYELSDEDIIEEMLADNMSRSARRAEIIDSLRGQRNIFQRLMDYIKDTYNRIKDFFETPRNGLNRNQRDIMDREIKKLADSIQKLDNSKPKYGKFEVKFSNPEQIVEVTGREFGDYTDIKDLRKKAIQYYRDNLQGTSVVNEELGRIDFDHNSIVEFTGAGRDKVKSSSAQETKLLLIPYLPQLIENGTKVTGREANKQKNEGKYYYYMRAFANIDGEARQIDITLEKFNDGHIVFYNHNISNSAGNEKKIDGTADAFVRSTVLPDGTTSPSERQSSSIEGKSGNNVAPESLQGKALGTRPINSPSNEPVNSAVSESPQSEALDSPPVDSSLNESLSEDSGNVKFSRKQDLSDEERINTAVKKSSKLQKLAEQLGATIQEDNVTFADPDTAKKFLGVLDSEYGINIAYHGSGADFDSFDLSKIGSGEGSQVHGWGLYFAQNEKISQSYKRLQEKLTGRFKHGEITTQDGIVYEIGVDSEGIWKDWHAKDSPQRELELGSLITALSIRLDAELEVKHGSISKAENYINEQIDQFRDFNPFPNPYNKPNYAEQEHAKLLKLLRESKKWTVEIEESEPPKGHMYQLNLPAKKYMLDEQKSFDEQSKYVQTTLQDINRAQPEYFKGELSSMNGRDIYRAISRTEGSDRKASEILWKNGIQGITYVGRRDGRCFVAFDPQLIQILRKYSKKKGNLFQNQEFLSKTDLTSSQKKLQEFGKSLGVPTVFFKGDKNLNGYYTGGISFLNTESDRSLEWTFWHESFHWLKSNNPKLYNQMIEGIKKAQPFSKEQLDAYREKVGLSTLSDDDVLEEMLADTMPEAADRLGLMESMNRSLTERLVSWLKETLNKFVEFFHNPAGKLTTKQRDAMIKSFNKFATQLTDSAGNQIFNLNPKTKQLEVNKNKTNSVAQVTSTDVKYSINAPVDRFNRAAQKLASKLGMKPSTDRITVQNPERNTDEFGIIKYVASSPSRIKNRAFQFYYEAGRNATQKLVRLRNNYSRKLAEAIDPISSEQKSELYDLLWQGDAEGKEFGKLTSAEKSGKTVPEMDQLRAEKVADETGVDKKTAEAYVKIRRLMNAVYHQLDSAKRKPKVKTERLENANFSKINDNKFIEVIDINATTITYKEYPHWQRVVDGVPNQAVEQMKKDPDIQISKVKDNEDGTSRVEWFEGYNGLNRREGYIPHLFHEWRVRIRKQDENGNWQAVTEGNGSYGGMIDSGRTQREALKNAENWLKSNQLKDGEQIFIEPAQMNFESLGLNESDDDMKYRESDYAPIMGDKDFHIMQSNIAHNQGLTIKDVKAILDGSVKLANRRRFFGNFLKRNGSKGFEEDLDFVLRHYLNSSARYIAMDEFKSKTISQFERQFGKFGDDYVGKNALADYVKDYIRDVNGNPPTMENLFNNMLNNNTLYQRFIGSSFGERAALSAVNSLTHRIGYSTLGMGNVSSALLNLSQLINAYGYLGEGTNLIKYLAKYSKPGSKFDSHDLRILTRCGTLEDMGLDANSGYDKNRGMVSHLPILNQIDKVGNFSMKLFQKADAIARIATTLTAYDKAIKEGKSERDAIKYARDVCRDSNFDYSQADAPNIFRRGSIISQLGLQFKKYGLKELEVMSDFLSNRTDKNQKLRFWGTYFLMVGLMGIPIGDFLDWIFKEFLNVGSPKDFVQRSIMEVCGDSKEGKALGKIAMYGIGSTMNANISTRVGMQDVFPTQPSNLAGPAVSKIYNLVHDLRHNGLGLQAIRDVSPGIYNILAATYGEAPGNRNRLNSKYEDVYSKVLRGMGFKSMDETIETDIQRIVYNTRDKLTEEKQSAIDEYLDNPTSENARKLRQLKIKPETVKEERRRKRQTRLKRTKDSLTRQEKKMNREMFRFAR